MRYSACSQIVDHHRAGAGKDEREGAEEFCGELAI